MISWAEIDLRAIRSNLAGIKNLITPTTRLMAIVKANAYGHGMIEVARVCLEEGATYLGVATPDEAISLRNHGITADILVMGYVPESSAEVMVENGVDAAVFNLDTALALSAVAQGSGREAHIHLKIDTGMGRIGFKPNPEDLEIIKKISILPGIKVQGIFSHLATSDHADKTYAYEQVNIFKDFVEQVEKAGIRIPLKHLANSAAIMEMPDAQFDMVRAGITIYGLYPSDEIDQGALPLIPAMTLKSRISFIKQIETGQSISYGRTFISQNPIKVATVSIGYADGYNRLLSNRAWATIKGKKAPLIGRVCMDQCMFDVSEIDDVKVGDEIILFGKLEDGITADDLAGLIGTINYEIVCSPHSRIERIYVD